MIIHSKSNRKCSKKDCNIYALFAVGIKKQENQNVAVSVISITDQLKKVKSRKICLVKTANQ